MSPRRGLATLLSRTLACCLLLAAQTLFFTAALPVNAADSSITLAPISPGPAACEPLTFSWTGGSPPFFVMVKNDDGSETRQVGPTDGNSVQWTPDFPSGTQLSAIVLDGNEVTSPGQTFVVQSGGSSCAGSNAGPSPTPTPSSTAVVTEPNTASPTFIITTSLIPKVSSQTLNSGGFSQSQPTSSQGNINPSTTPLSANPSAASDTSPAKSTQTEGNIILPTTVSLVVLSSVSAAAAATTTSASGPGGPLNNSTSPHGDSLRPGVIAGIVVGGVVGVATLSGLCFWLGRGPCLRRRRRRSRIASSEARQQEDAPRRSVASMTGSSLETDGRQLGNAIPSRVIRGKNAGNATATPEEVWAADPPSSDVEGAEETRSEVPSTAPPPYSEA